MDAARPDEGPPAAALVRLLDASWKTAERYAVLMRVVGATSPATPTTADSPR